MRLGVRGGDDVKRRMMNKDGSTHRRTSAILRPRVKVISTSKPTLVEMVESLSSNAEIGKMEVGAGKRR
jgi:hypothetical protein